MLRYLSENKKNAYTLFTPQLKVSIIKIVFFFSSGTSEQILALSKAWNFW